MHAREAPPPTHTHTELYPKPKHYIQKASAETLTSPQRILLYFKVSDADKGEKEG